MISRLFLFMPFIVVSFLIFMFYCGPGDFMRGLFTVGIITSIFFIFVLIPGAVKGLFVDILRVRGQYVLHAVW
ncbi:hypothetical protein EcWSU1_02630 [Enterobacter ludwigii]|uniref:Uncharacterized protein n=1 Tax=Enterobacter ludwigii TaxID=299767 RepID=G8LF80_9ENTR|nr:hypothetical protein EcWSU1_02630 [Enterobacter ludwigii]